MRCSLSTLPESALPGVPGRPTAVPGHHLQPSLWACKAKEGWESVSQHVFFPLKLRFTK